jgi:hypothetical protein
MPYLQRPMTAEEFFSAVEKHFQFLFDEHGFVVTKKEISDHFDVCELMLQSKNWRIRIGRERGSVYVYIAPASDPETWFGLGGVITFLQRESQEAQQIWWGPRLSWSLDYNVRLEQLLKWYGDKLEAHAGQIAAIFRDEGLERTLSELQVWQELKEKQARDALARGDYPSLDE